MWRATNWKIFCVLLALSLLSVASVFPYALTIQGDVLRKLSYPVELVFLVQLVQSVILFSAAIFFGLFFTRKINFKLPLIDAVLQKGNYKAVLKNIAGVSIVSGIFSAVAIYTADALFVMQGVGISTHENYAPVWQKLLASLYGGVAEEILLRLFLMTFLIWIGMKLYKRDQPTRAGIIVSIALAAVVFGLGHLPVTAALTAITPLIVLRAVVLNGIGGVIFGWLFWKKGLEAAMFAHFVTDVFLLTLLPFIHQSLS